MKLVDYCEKDNTAYICSTAILPNTKGMDRKQRTKLYHEWFSKTYAERIELSPYRDEINAELAKHEGCKISEYSAL